LTIDEIHFPVDYTCLPEITGKRSQNATTPLVPTETLANPKFSDMYSIS